MLPLYDCMSWSWFLSPPLPLPLPSWRLSEALTLEFPRSLDGLLSWVSKVFVYARFFLASFFAAVGATGKASAPKRVAKRVFLVLGFSVPGLYRVVTKSVR